MYVHITTKHILYHKLKNILTGKLPYTEQKATYFYHCGTAFFCLCFGIGSLKIEFISTRTACIFTKYISL